MTRRCQSKDCYNKLTRREGDVCDFCKAKLIFKEKSDKKLKLKNKMEEEKTDNEETTGGEEGTTGGDEGSDTPTEGE